MTAAAARRCLDGKAKPPGSLGALEEMAARLAVLQGSTKPVLCGSRLLVFAADHGVSRSRPEVSAYPRGVTPGMFRLIAGGRAACNVLAAQQQCGVSVVDVGIDHDVSRVQAASPGTTCVLHRKVARGTADFTQGPAMTPQECQQAMAAGTEAVALACEQLSGASAASAHAATAAAAAAAGGGDGGGPPGCHWRDGYGVIAVGELGIGNTTAAAALTAALCPGLQPEEVCGRGTGVDDSGLRAKQQAVAAALAANSSLIKGGPGCALQAVGGLELAAMAGAYLECWRRGMPAVVDGFISGAAALAALRMQPELRSCLFVSHQSAEAGAQRLLQELDCGSPVLQLGLRLGEGTGALLALPLLRSAAAIMRDMATLEDALAADDTQAAP